MSDFMIRKTKADELQALERLAREIWTEHYTALIGAEQVEYMLAKFQSAAYIQNQIDSEGYVYYIAFIDSEAAGYCAVKPDGNELFLSKIYVRKAYRGRGLARSFISHFTEEFRGLPFSKIRLTVNKNNSGSIAAYQKLGFAITDAVVSDIGGGFVMNDYIMEKILVI